MRTTCMELLCVLASQTVRPHNSNIMSNATGAHAPLRVSELTSILQLKILGLLSPDGQPTDKLAQLNVAREKEDNGDILSMAERRLLDECASVIVD